MSGITKVSKSVLGDNIVSLSSLDATGAAVGKVLAVGIDNTLQFEDKLVTEDVEDIVAALILRGNHTNLSVSYIDGTNQLNLTVESGNADYLTINDGYATETYVDTEISNLVASAPATLDTLNELAAALGDDPNFATTIATNISTKVSKSGDTMTGDLTVPNIIVSGNVDGRDVSADGTKLDGIEAGATADQTASEIRSLVEAATDSNVFTDADHSKLNAIGANAKDDQTITAGSGLTGGGTGDVTLSHADTSTVADVNGSGNTFIQDIGFDTYGHVTSIGTGTVTLGDGAMTVTAGSGLSGGGQLGTANQSGPSSISLSVTDAPKWSTARTLSLSGDASGSVSWDGSANATLDVTVTNTGAGSTTFGDVGTYAFLRYTPNYASISPNTNYAGSSLQYTSIHRSAGNNILMPTNGGSPSGTWQSMGGGTNNLFGGTNWPATLFVRIS